MLADAPRVNRLVMGGALAFSVVGDVVLHIEKGAPDQLKGSFVADKYASCAKQPPLCLWLLLRLRLLTHARFSSSYLFLGGGGGSLTVSCHVPVPTIHKTKVM